MPTTDIFIPTARNCLRALAGWLDKAADHASQRGEGPDALMTLRLAPDMYPLAAQVRFVAFQAQEGIHRLLGQAVPEALLQVRQEGWTAGDRPGTYADAKLRVEEAVSFLAVADPSGLRPGADRPIALELPNGMAFDMSGADFARDWVLPQLYFHHVTAYAILRNHGVALGKADFVPHMFAYLRPGTMPGG